MAESEQAQDIPGFENHGAQRMTVRQPPFEFNRHEARESWHPLKPEFAHIVNSASLSMPYLEPYLIRSMREARPLIRDERLREELDLYVRQEAAHYKQHRNFNDALAGQGYQCLADLEQRLDDDYSRLGQEKSLKFNLAYAEGFESMALAIGHMLIEDREYLFGRSDSAVASLVLWHFVEEIEHKNVAFDVFDHLYGSYFWRIFGLVYATGHMFWRTGQGYRALLKEDGLWYTRRSRWTLLKLLGRIFRKLTPKLLRILRPGYHPGQIDDPGWGLAWEKLFSSDHGSVARLNTDELAGNVPISQNSSVPL